VVGNFLTQWQVKKTKQMENAHEVRMAEVQIDILKAQTDASIKITQAKVQGAVDLQDSKAYGTTIVMANQKSFSDKWIDKLLDMEGKIRYFTVPCAFLIMGPLAFVDVLKGFMRPVLTLGFTAGFAYLMYVSYDILETAEFTTLSAEQAVMYFTLGVDTCVMLTTTCVTWWFGDRRAAKALHRLTEKRLAMNNVIAPEIKFESERPINK
jgi:hypothetical protein